MFYLRLWLATSSKLTGTWLLFSSVSHHWHTLLFEWHCNLILWTTRTAQRPACDCVTWNDTSPGYGQTVRITHVLWWTFPGASCWAISIRPTVHWCGTSAEQHIHQKRNASSTELWNSFTMILTPALKNWLLAPTYQPWRCIVKGTFLWKYSNPISPSFMWDLFRVKDVNITYEVTGMCVYIIAGLRNMGWLYHTMEPSKELACYQMTRRNT